MGYNTSFKKNTSNFKELITNKINDKQKVELSFCFAETRSNQITDMDMIKKSEALIFAYDLHDIDSLKLVFKLYNQVKPVIQ